jgi:hypothetical protein
VDEVLGAAPDGGSPGGGAPAPAGGGAAPAPAPGGAADVQPAFPIRAAFYYPWFPEAWHQRGLDPFTHYTPSSGFYDGSDTTTIARQVSDLGFAGMDAAIASWWGVGSRTDGRIRSLLDVTAARGSPLRWTLYYERESTGDPSPAEISADLGWIDAAYAHHPAYLRVGGRPVIFVYAAPGDGCGMAARWAAANTLGFYVVLKVFPGYHTCAPRPDSWHQYAPASAADEQRGYSYAISPGFFQADEAAPRLARDIDRFRGGVRDMVASGAPWQLVTTYNEWGEGTAVESAVEWSSGDGRGLYLDALHDDGAAP